MKNKKKLIWTVYIIMFAFIFILHSAMGYVSDDGYYIELLDSHSRLYGILLSLTSSPGRFLTDTLGTSLTYIPIWIWKLADSLVYVGIAKMLVYLLDSKEKIENVIAVCLCLLLFPFEYLSSAGYVHTSTNYVYTTACIISSMIPIKKVMDKRKVSGLCIAGGVFAAIYASNQEQSAILMIMLLLFAAVVNHERILEKYTKDYDKVKMKRIILCELLVSVIGIILVVTNPEHIIRAAQTSGNYTVPGYSNWDVWDKLYHGYTSTVANILFMPIISYLLFCLCLFVIAVKNRSTIVKIGISAVPLTVEIFMMATGFSHFKVIYDYTYGMPELRDMSTGAIHVIVPLVISIIVFSCIIIGMHSEIKNRLISSFMIYMFIISCTTRLMMGFAASLYGSSFRTFIYLIYFFIIAIMFYVIHMMDEIDGKIGKFAVLGVVAAFAIRNSISFLHIMGV